MVSAAFESPKVSSAVPSEWAWYLLTGFQHRCEWQHDNISSSQSEQGSVKYVTLVIRRCKSKLLVLISRTAGAFGGWKSERQAQQKTYFSNVLNRNLEVKHPRPWNCLKFGCALRFISSESCQCQDIPTTWAALNIAEVLWRLLYIFSLEKKKKKSCMA